MREHEATRGPSRPEGAAVPGREPEFAPAPMDLTVGEAILEAAELNSGVPAPRGSAAPGSPPAADAGVSRPCAAEKPVARAAKPVSRDDDGRPVTDRGGEARRPGEEVRCHG